ncbi:MAG TPA: GNAT family N-acetyltransferase [Gemmataceae bacterium]|nr:GNAT family N-acetyltransferase [Gemmataceae bacterium]
MVQYRTFRNDDPPRLAQVWNAALTGRGTVQLRHSSPLEHYVFAKPYFDPAGLILALDGAAPVGFAHAGFGPNEDGSRLSTDKGVTCLLGVAPSHRRRGIGSELLRRCEDYLRGRGATELFAGSMPPLSPFYLGVYGGSDAPGFLLSDASAESFLTRHGYRTHQTRLVFHCRLSHAYNVVDARFANLRNGYDIRAQARGRPATWWQAAVLGPLEMLEFTAENKTTHDAVATVSVWEMEGFSHRWNESALGLVDVEVRPDARRQGMAKYLLSQALRYLRDQYFTLAEMQVCEANEAGRRLCQSLGFKQVDAGRMYRKTV